MSDWPRLIRAVCIPILALCAGFQIANCQTRAALSVTADTLAELRAATTQLRADRDTIEALSAGRCQSIRARAYRP